MRQNNILYQKKRRVMPRPSSLSDITDYSSLNKLFPKGDLKTKVAIVVMNRLLDSKSSYQENIGSDMPPSWLYFSWALDDCITKVKKEVDKKDQEEVRKEEIREIILETRFGKTEKNREGFYHVLADKERLHHWQKGQSILYDKLQKERE